LDDVAATLPSTDRSGPLTLKVFDSLAGAEPSWRLLEAHAVLTPYQRFDWIDALVAAGGETDGRIAIIVVFHKGRPVGLLPLIVEKRFGIGCARLLGSHLTNSDWMILDPAIAPMLDRRALTALLAEAGAGAGGFDLVEFSYLPALWQGVANPLLNLPHELAPNNLYYAIIGPTPAPYIDHRIGQKRRANIRRGARRLEEMFGKLELRRVNDAAELDKVHRAFLAQRAERFDQMAVKNIFAEDYFVKFFKSLATRSFNASRPALSFHALYAGDEIVATCCGAFAGNHYSQYINSTASGPAAKYSLIGVLMGELCDELNAAGVVSTDMGIGDFDYKTEWTEPQVLYDSIIPVTARARLLAPLLVSARKAKRIIKQDKRLWALAQRVIRLKYNLGKRLRGESH
jgi:CelD/BcsL family acetyltransferase involved in cellulose biosynthesis